MRALSSASHPRVGSAAHRGVVRSRRLLLGLGAVLMVVAVAIGWTALRPAAVGPGPLPSPIRISESAPPGTEQDPAPAVPPSATPASPAPDVVPPPPLPGGGADDDVDDDSDDDDADD